VGGLSEKGVAPTRPIVGDEPEITLDDDPIALLTAFTERSWCDGLPIVPPTAERVAAMLGGRDGARVLGAMPPVWRQATLEKLAVNAVMAGCEPAAFPDHRGRGRGHAGSDLQPLWRAGHDPPGGAAARRQRSVRPPDRPAFRQRLLRTRLPGQRHDRARDPSSSC
jgi:hypothetical protein